jgi:hypothetical protein
MDASDQIITQLVDSICLNKWASPMVRRYHFLLQYQKIISELGDIYTESEKSIIMQRIQSYPFNDFISCPRDKDVSYDSK